jgi:Icc protein
VIPHQIEPVNNDVVHLLQITDSHIFADPAACLWDMNTRQSFAAVCKQVIENKHPADALLATGDLSQDGSAESYQYLADYFERMEIPTFWIPGNHDDSRIMDEYLNSGRVNPAKQLLIGNWQVVLLDSTIAEEVCGRVSESQLAFLDSALEQFTCKHALVCLHHQALPSGSNWIDQKGLKDSARLKNLLARHDNVKGVLWGHVHQETHCSIDGVEWMSTPSSCIQFKPGAEEFCIGSERPGYRRLSLFADGHIETQVHRIDNSNSPLAGLPDQGHAQRGPVGND